MPNLQVAKTRSLRSACMISLYPKCIEFWASDVTRFNNFGPPSGQKNSLPHILFAGPAYHRASLAQRQDDGGASTADRGQG
jgi:hypothetical protein